MREPGGAVQTAEKIAGVVAIVAALVVLNGALQNQHNWQNLSWRLAMAAVLLALAVIVETNALGMVQRARDDGEETSVPEFLRADRLTAPDVSGNEGARIERTEEVRERP